MKQDREVKSNQAEERTFKEGRAFSHHESDPLYSGDEKHSHDAFGAFCILEHSGNTKEATKAAAKDLGIQQKKSQSEKTQDTLRLPPMPQGFSAPELMQREFPEPMWIIPDILTEGLGMLAGRPKTGKSWMALNLSVATATGGRVLGKIKVEKGPVLYLALEDPERRLKNRLSQILCHGMPPRDLYFFNQWPRIDEGALPLLSKWLDDHQETRFVIIDTLARLWPKGDKSNGNTLYHQDYQTLSAIKTIADRHRISILLIHHLRKALSEDPLEQISGSMGISGSADTLLILQRSRGKADANLLVTGRDVEERELALQFDGVTGTWRYLGNAYEYGRSQEQVAVLEALKEAGEAMSLKDISAILKKKNDTVFHLMKGLLRDGVVKKEGHGKYIFTQSTQLTQCAQSTQLTQLHHNPGDIEPHALKLSHPDSTLDASVSGVHSQIEQIEYIDRFNQTQVEEILI
jgi:hypothetical protein